MNEAKTAMRLLDIVERDGIYEVTMIEEQTPEGWKRVGSVRYEFDSG